MLSSRNYSMYSLLNDKEWLYQKYIVEKLSTVEISKIVGCKASNSVRQCLIRHNIPVRGYSEAQVVNRDETDFILDNSVITGCMLGDATMPIHSKTSGFSNPSFRKKNKYKDHVECVAKILLPDTWGNRVKPTLAKLNGKVFQLYMFDTLSRKTLLPYYKKWYPNGIKVVPDDIVIDEIALLHWFLDDGYSYKRNRGYYEIVTGLETQGFILEDVNRLCKITKDNFDLGFKPTPYKSRTTGAIQWRMRLPQKQSKHFFEVVGPSPVESLSYKWK